MSDLHGANGLFVGSQGLVYEEAVAWAVGLDVDSTPAPWFERAEEYGARAWRVAGPELAAVGWDSGNGWMTIMTLEPVGPMEPLGFRAAAVGFWSRLAQAMEDLDVSG